MMRIELDEHELWFFVQTISAGAFWPPMGSPGGALMYQSLPKEHLEDGGGVQLRVRLLAAYAKMTERPGRYKTLPFEVNMIDAWILDSVIWNVNTDIRNYRFPSGGTLYDTARKVWAVLLPYHITQIPDALMPEDLSYAGNDNAHADRDAGGAAHEGSALADADDTIAAIERAIAESRAGKGAGPNLPAAEA